jgi:hypothetical protein
VKVKSQVIKTYESRISHISALSNGIIRVEIKNKIELHPEDLDENLAIYKEILGPDKKGLFLLVFAKEGSSTKEGREKFASAERSAIKKAEALVVFTMGHRIESNFYKNFFNPKHPVRIFDNEEKALKWLLSFENDSADGNYETSIAKIHQIDEDILKVEVLENIEISEQGLKENLAIYQKTIPNGGYLLTVFNEFNTANPKVKPVFESPNRTGLKKGEAYVVKGLSNRIELEYYIKRTKQIYPSEVFEDEEAALNWLKELRKENAKR